MSKVQSYQYEEIMKYQSINNKLPKQLAAFCIPDRNGTTPKLDTYSDQLNDIVVNITRGINPNRVVFRNFVKSYVNMMTSSNYTEFLQKLKSLDYHSKENIHFLVSELVITAVRCPLSVKGFTFSNDSSMSTIPEICADVTKHFSKFKIENNNDVVQFHEEIIRICQQYFLDFVDMGKSMDENNNETSDNYKGFMTFMGLLHARGVINTKVVINCMDTVKRAIYATHCMSSSHSTDNADHNCVTHSELQLMGSKRQYGNKLANLVCYFDCNQCGKPSADNVCTTFRKNIECSNLHKGYEHMLSHVVRSLSTRATDIIEKADSLKLQYDTAVNTNEKVEECKEAYDAELQIISKLASFADIIINSHQEMANLNKYYKSVSSQSRAKYVSPLGVHSIINHNATGKHLNNLQDKLSAYTSNFTTRYTEVSIIK